jgi:sec-independent protein translocase protein TatB
VTAQYGKVSLHLMGTPPTIEFASLGMWDSLILMVMALVVFGPRRLPEIGRQIGKLMYEFRKASNDFKFQMEEELRNAEEADRRKKEEERQKALAAPAQPALTATASHASDASPGAAETVANPNAGEEIYPSATPETVEAQIEETYPRIMPPSTGEQVAAARPNSLTALSAAANEFDAAADIGAEPVANAAPGPEAAAAAEEPLTSDPEQAAHHG